LTDSITDITYSRTLEAEVARYRSRSIRTGSAASGQSRSDRTDRPLSRHANWAGSTRSDPHAPEWIAAQSSSGTCRISSHRHTTAASRWGSGALRASPVRRLSGNAGVSDALFGLLIGACGSAIKANALNAQLIEDDYGIAETIADGWLHRGDIGPSTWCGASARHSPAATGIGCRSYPTHRHQG